MVSQLTFGLIGITMFLKKGDLLGTNGGGGGRGGALVKLCLPLKSGCKESQFYSLPFGQIIQAVVSMY